MTITRIAYVTNMRNTFTNIDKEILEDRYRVLSLYFSQRHPRILLESWRAIKDVELVVAWFASWHSLPPFIAGKLYGKPCLLITGGYDVANVPEINYGLQRGGLPKFISTRVFNLATRTIAFSQTAYYEALQNTPLTDKDIGVLLLGVPNNPKFQHVIPKEDIVITIGNVQQTSSRRKGMIEFVQSAVYLPEMRFVVIGKHQDKMIDDLLG